MGILYGGRSVEHGVSINSARNIFEYIDKSKFEPVPIGIALDGTWYATDGVSKNIENGKPLSVILKPGSGKFQIINGPTFELDLIFPVLHGTDGEDGSIQGMLKALDIPMIGSGVLGSVLSMNKLVAKRLMKEAGIPVADFVSCYYDQRDSVSFDFIREKLGLPFMVKAANLGSSVGVSKVKSAGDFQKALDDSFQYDDCVLFEKFIQAREIECAILGNAPAKASLPGEIIISDKYEFYTFDAKYVDGDAVQIKVPADLPSEIIHNMQKLSLAAYTALGCEDFARVDLFLTAQGEIFVNEINTIPGFTNSSMFPMMWRERGISFTELISTLAQLSMERFEKAKRISRDFQSSLKF